MENFKSKLEAIIKSVVNYDISLNDDIELAAIGINSMKFIQIVIAIEEEFGIEFDDEHLNNELFKTIGSLTNFVATKISA